MPLVEYAKTHALEITIIVLLVILLLITMRKEKYIGDPMSALGAYTSGMIQRRGGQIFTATNQGESMVGHKDPPYYMPQADAMFVQQFYDKDVSKLPPNTINPPHTDAIAAAPKESYDNGRGKVDNDYLTTLLY